MAQTNVQETRGFYRLNWLQRIGFGSGDLAQNLIYQTICMYLLFFYTDIYGLKPAPILCFWNGFADSDYNIKLTYAYITYVGLSMLYTLINVPYGALNSSLTRDTDEITILTSVRMFMANCGGLAVGSGLPLLVAFLAPMASGADSSLPKDPQAWFVTMAIYAVIGLALLFFCFSQCKERVVMDESETKNVKVSDLWTEFMRNRPLRIIAFFFITAFAMMSVGNAAGSYFVTSNLHGTAAELSIFMGLGSIPSFIFMPLVPAIKKAIGKKNMFYVFLSIAIIGMIFLYIVAKMQSPSMTLVYIAQFVKSTGVIVATGYMWALVPEVISYGEYTSGKRIAGIVNALTGIFYKAGMALGGVVPGAVLAYVAYNKDSITQTPLAEEGILWLVCVIPAMLLALAMFIISRYELTDEVIDKINKDIEDRQK